VDLWRRTGIDRPWLDLDGEIDEMARHDLGLFLVAAEEGSVVGAVMGAYDGRRGWIYHLAVEPSLQGHGIGDALMRNVEARMRQQGVRKINLQVRADNGGVLRYYERLGYKREELVSMGKRL